MGRAARREARGDPADMAVDIGADMIARRRRPADEAKAGNGPTAAERAEIRELKAELERVRRERDILGKAVAYFSASHPRNV